MYLAHPDETRSCDKWSINEELGLTSGRRRRCATTWAFHRQSRPAVFALPDHNLLSQSRGLNRVVAQRSRPLPESLPVSTSFTLNAHPCSYLPLIHSVNRCNKPINHSPSPASSPLCLQLALPARSDVTCFSRFVFFGGGDALTAAGEIGDGEIRMGLFLLSVLIFS